VKNESRLKRLYLSAAATVIAAAIWFASGLWEFFLFPRHRPLQEKMLFAVYFLIAVWALLFIFGRFVQKRNVALVLVSSALAGLGSSVMIFMFWNAYLSSIRGDWRDFSSIKKMADMVVVYTWGSSIRGTFALAAFTALAYRYLPNLVDFIRSKYRSRQTEGTTRGK